MNEERTKGIHDLLVTMELGVLETLRLPKNDVKESWHNTASPHLFRDMVEEYNEVLDAIAALKSQPMVLEKEDAADLDHLQLELRDLLATTAFMYERVCEVMQERGFKRS